MSERRFYVTTPIYYVNDDPHIGHCYSTILADVLARYHRMFGYEVRFQTGTDEHGQKVQQAAAARGVTPQQHCDEFSQHFRKMWERLGIQYDHFIRTTDEDHKKTVRVLLQCLFDQGDIYKHTYSGWYNVSDEMFISDSDVTEEGKETGKIVFVSEDNYFLRLSKYQEWLLNYLTVENPTFILPESRRNEVIGLLRQPVGDLCISRPKSRLGWGIELPFDTDYVTYVWIDALTNYITGIGWPDSAEFEKWWPHSLHLIGKDILKPHGFFWPIFLHAAGVGLPEKILAHGWWTRGGQKESKTVTKALAAQAPVRHIREFLDDYGVDPVRYFLIREMTVGMDQEYSEEIIVQRLNSDLANDLGNLLSRVTKLIKQYFGSKAPELAPSVMGSSEKRLAEQASQLFEEVHHLVTELKTNVAVDQVIALVRATNAYIAACEPWAKAKEGNTDSAGTCLALSLRCLRCAAILLHPVMPSKMEDLLRQIGTPLPENGLSLTGISLDEPRAGQPVPGGDPLFPRIDWAEVQKKLAATAPVVEAAPEAEAVNLVTIDEFKKTDLRVAKVLTAEKVPKADKLLRLQIEIGAEIRQIVAGVAQYYTPEEMVGKLIIVVANLQPAKIRGLESKGMLLAARDGDRLRLITVEGEGIASGATVG
jgi:methionyl-tRNA synthetase